MDKHDKKSKKTSKKAKKNNANLSPLVDSMIDEWETAGDEDVADILGSYTGNPDIGLFPEQDADDL